MYYIIASVDLVARMWLELVYYIDSRDEAILCTT